MSFMTGLCAASSHSESSATKSGPSSVPAEKTLRRTTLTTAATALPSASAPNRRGPWQPGPKAHQYLIFGSSEPPYANVHAPHTPPHR